MSLYAIVKICSFRFSEADIKSGQRIRQGFSVLLPAIPQQTLNQFFAITFEHLRRNYDLNMLLNRTPDY